MADVIPAQNHDGAVFADAIHTYECDRAAKPFGYSAEEFAELRERAVEILRCAVDGSDSDYGRTIELTALELDASLFATLLARLWAQHVAAMRDELFENSIDVLLEAALQLES